MSVTLHTSLGNIKLELHCREAPRSSANFLALSASRAYHGTLFHRVSPRFLAQGGDPTGTGRRSVAAFARRLPDEIVPALTFGRAGVLAFANGGSPSARGVGSQFFITVAPASQLDGTCTIVGKVIGGLDVVEAISCAEAEGGRPKVDVVVEEVTVHANPFATGELHFQVP